MDPLFLLLIVAMLALPVILNSRRQKRAIADAQRLQSSLTDGDRVVTTCGLHATVVSSTDETTVDLEIAPGVRTTWVRAAIREKIIEDNVTGDNVTEDGDEAVAVSAPLAPPLTAAPTPTTPD
jgi:preprotein translocase subunit YajC